MRDIYNPDTEAVTAWGIGVFTDDGVLTSVITRRESMTDVTRPPHTEETARKDREDWVTPGVGAWAVEPHRIRVVSQTRTPWSPS